MNKLFTYTKIAACVTAVMAALLIISIFKESSLWTCTIGFLNFSSWPILTSLCYASLIVFFAIVLSSSAKGSPLRVPCTLGIVFTSLKIIPMLLNVDYTSPLYMYGSFISILLDLGIAVALIWLAKYFGKTSIKIFAVLFVAIPLFLDIYWALYSALNLWNIITNDTSMVIHHILNIVRWLCLPIFYLLFSFINKNK